MRSRASERAHAAGGRARDCVRVLDAGADSRSWGRPCAVGAAADGRVRERFHGRRGGRTLRRRVSLSVTDPPVRRVV
ncbi:hypothetical protein WN71_037595 [Streptomyces mangrovisoli]|uniref:Uncharacterized protein n=1 Tax=Streptomyces mangrovisoli TaxID=1428628 RepID=A0A1J4NKK9_9ACTN|nr:hypothetical protein WN71_037595 [Streptomyces mangrovisoli]